MLHDQERRALYEIQASLAAEDPLFARRMQPQDQAVFPAVPVLCAAVFIATPIVALLFGWRPGLLVLLLAALAVIAVAACRR